VRTRLSVPDISCGACKAALEGALAPVAGVREVEVDIAGRMVDIVHEPSVDADRLVQVVEDQGYEVAAREVVG
jgi:copper chaperone CopZ